ncbi:MAG: hypothetical protein II329_03215, partial [Clostridia bacterium]|nr:hypothetical protein [Clostridia bacterium]
MAEAAEEDKIKIGGADMEERGFILKSEYQPTGDQPEAIRALVEGIEAGERAQTLVGVTGSGKT